MISHICRRHFSTPSRSSTFDYCLNIVQKRAHEQYLATLLLPPSIKACGIILRAFNVEISSIRDQISAKPAGIGRMVFWHELVDNVYSSEGKITDRHHPIAIELQKVVRTFDLTKDLFHRMIDAREIFINDDIRPPFDTIADVEAYAEKAFSSIYYLLLEALASTDQQDGHARHAANQLGKVEGLLTLLRGVPHHASKLRKVYLPITLLADHKVSTESIIRQSFEAEHMNGLSESIAASADEHLRNCRFRSKYLTKEERQVLLPAVCADRYMARLHRAQCDIFNAQLQSRDAWLPAILYWNKIKSTY